MEVRVQVEAATFTASLSPGKKASVESWARGTPGLRWVGRPNPCRAAPSLFRIFVIIWKQ